MRDKAYITYAFAAVNVLVFLVLELLGDTEDINYMTEMGAMWPGRITEQGQYWRFVTANFLHFGFEHVACNMLILLCAGPFLEKALGHIRFFVFYLGAGIGCSALSFGMMLKSGEWAVSAGASGANFGIIGGLLWIVILHKGSYETLTGSGLLFMIAVSIIGGITSSEIDNWGHIGGLLAGFLLCMIFYRKKPKTVDFTDESLYT